MIDRCGHTDQIFRDGTSQQTRRLPALDPAHFSVEERSTEDLIRFARKFAAELKFFNLNNEQDGDWTGFLGPHVDPVEPGHPDYPQYLESEARVRDLVAFIDNPDQFDKRPEKLSWLARPHLSVFLSFLEMLREPKRQLDELTRRHLDFYYREVLQLPAKAAVADRVHVLFEPARGVDAHMIEAGTLLHGGKDSTGKELLYATEEELLVTQARVVDIRRVLQSREGKVYADISWQAGQEVEPGAKYHALGCDLDQSETDNPHLAEVGFAISSPLLELSEGEREIRLRCCFPKDSKLTRAEIETCLKEKFIYYLSEEEDWLEIGEVVVTIENPEEADHYLKITLTLPNEAPSIIANAALAPGLYPVLKATLDQSAFEDQLPLLQKLRQLTVKSAGLQVAVDAMKAIAIRNDEGVLSPEGTFQPFGSWPRIESAFTFAHRELCRKGLNYAKLKVTWKGKPDFADRYQYYTGSDIEDDSSFKVGLKTAGLEIPNISLFTDTDEATTGATNYIEFGTFTVPEVNGDIPDSDDPYDYPRYFKILLQAPDFQHDRYAVVLQQTDPNVVVEPPYTPEIQPLELSYTSVNAVVDLSTKEDSLHRFWQLQPFGFAPPCTSGVISGDLPLLGASGGDGLLLIGLSGTEVTDTLSLLFQIHPGYSDENTPTLQWSYLDRNCWQPIPEKQILVDRTNNFLGAGLVRIELPKVKTLDHQALPGGRYWLRASANLPEAKAVGDLVAVHAQAATAGWIDRDNAADHLDRPLPAESITELLRRDPYISAVQQPYTSFGARPAERPANYHTRISERLRHKQRALSGWDYERLVLDRFPEVYKVKCLSPREKTQLPVNEGLPKPGKVILVVIPNVARAAPFFPLEPRLSNEKREEIRKYVEQYASPFTRIEVRNPRFEYIRYRMDIRYLPGYDEILYGQKLNEALHRFLCPWAYEASADIAFGSRIFHSEVIYFIEKLPYVDYVVNFKLARQYLETEPLWDCIDDYGCAAARYPDSVLVSHREHFIGPVYKAEFDPRDYKGVGYEIIGVDLKVK